MTDQELLNNQLRNIGKRLADLERAVKLLGGDKPEKAKPATFTPGPWEVGEADNVNHTIGIDSSGWIQFVDCYWRTDGPKTIEVAKANARLIAEAPAMFAVLEKLSHDGEWNVDEVSEIIDRVKGE